MEYCDERKRNGREEKFTVACGGCHDGDRRWCEREWVGVIVAKKCGG